MSHDVSTYNRREFREQCLQNSDVYIGSTDERTEEHYVPVDGKMVLRSTTSVEALVHIFDEVFSNAADNAKKCDMKYIEVSFQPHYMPATAKGPWRPVRAATSSKAEASDKAEDQVSDEDEDEEEKQEQNVQTMIRVKNDGKTIPIATNDLDEYWPTTVFSRERTGSNFNDRKDSTTKGKNGTGVKAANVMSLFFRVTCCDGEQQFVQEWRDNLGTAGKPKITKAKVKKPFTMVEFVPDYKRFGLDDLDKDNRLMMLRKVYDVAGAFAGALTIRVDRVPVPVKSFSHYVKMFADDDKEGKNHLVLRKLCDGWGMGVMFSDSGFRQMSMVNQSVTELGGTHVIKVRDLLAEKLVHRFRAHGVTKPHQVYNRMFLFVSATVPGAKYNAQTKTELKTSPKHFPADLEINDSTVDAIAKGPIGEAIKSLAQSAQEASVSRAVSGTATSKRVSQEKYDRANLAGTKHWSKCKLWVTEGDSAKTMVIKGRRYLDRDYHGVFPLRGKLLNVRKATPKQLKNCEEVKALCKILGLSVTEPNPKRLRYGGVMIATDSDPDGAHIKGLLLNFFHFYWPDLLARTDFVCDFITPVIKTVRDIDQRDSECERFYSTADFEAWRASDPSHATWSVQYYKGLGTSTERDIQYYFTNFDRHVVPFRYTLRDAESDNLIDLAFGKGNADARKTWLDREALVEPERTSDHVTIPDFVNRELVNFGTVANVRCVPKVGDNLKKVQRMILYWMLVHEPKRRVEPVKVAQLAGRIALDLHYPHGEKSIEDAIKLMAANFPGSNNLNLLAPEGQFGSRIQGGKDAASARYVFTRLSKQTRLLFRDEDLRGDILPRVTVEGKEAEVEVLAPIVPFFANGSCGIGMGWNVAMGNYRMEDLIDAIERRIRNEPYVPLHPCFRGQEECLTPVEGKPGVYRNRGRFTVEDLPSDDGQEDERVRVCITEVPVQRWLEDVKEKLESLETLPKKDVKKNEKNEKKARKPPRTWTIDDLDDQSSDLDAKWSFTCAKEHVDKVLRILNLDTQMTLDRFVLFDNSGKIRDYGSFEDVLEEFYHFRRGVYERRFAYQAREKEHALRVAENRARFVELVLNRTLDVVRLHGQDYVQVLESHGLVPIATATAPSKAGKRGRGRGTDAQHSASKKRRTESGAKAEKEEDNSDNDEDDETQPTFAYLLSMPFSSLNAKRKRALDATVARLRTELEALRHTKVEDMWLREIGELRAAPQDIEILETYVAPEERAGKASSAKKRKRASSTSSGKGQGKTKKPCAD